MLSHIESLVRAQRDPAVARNPADHRLRGLPLGGAGGVCGFGVDDQAIAVFHEQVAHVTALGSLPPSLAIEPGIRIGGRGMRLIAPLLPAEVALAVAPRAGRLVAALLGPEAFHAGPGLDQRP